MEKIEITSFKGIAGGTGPRLAVAAEVVDIWMNPEGITTVTCQGDDGRFYLIAFDREISAKIAQANAVRI